MVVSYLNYMIFQSPRIGLLRNSRIELGHRSRRSPTIYVCFVEKQDKYLLTNNINFSNLMYIKIIKDLIDMQNC